MSRMDQLITTIQVQIVKVTNNFYQQRIPEGYQVLIHVIDTITEIVKIIESIDNTPELMEENEKLVNALQDIMEAMTNKDTVLIADILKYDISEILNTIMNMKLY